MNLASSAQLDIIDKLRALGISNFVALPQVRPTYTIVRLGTNIFHRKACCGGGSVEVGLPSS
jgi:hypothetical protein